MSRFLDSPVVEYYYLDCGQFIPEKGSVLVFTIAMAYAAIAEVETSSEDSADFRCLGQDGRNVEQVQGVSGVKNPYMNFGSNTA